MRIVLDESVPRGLRTFFNERHHVRTVPELGWDGKKNGELLALLVEHRYDVLVTTDKNMRYQQDLAKYDISVFLLSAVSNSPATLRPLMTKLAACLDQGSFPKLMIIE